MLDGKRVTARQWREAALALRDQAAKFERLATKAEQSEEYAICGMVSESGPNREPLACGYRLGHEGAHAWSTLPTFTAALGRLAGPGEEER